MDDLGTALARGDEVFMLGGGNPAAIPAVRSEFRSIMRELVERSDEIDRVLGDYDQPHGSHAARAALAGYLEARYGWPVGADHVAFVPGSQSSFSYLFAMFAGTFADDRRRHIMMPISPEYIGYFGAALGRTPLTAIKPEIRLTQTGRFKYFIDWDRCVLDDSVGAVCVSVPTNPTGNVITREELTRLVDLTRDAGVPLLVDLAYGEPFPGLVHTAWEPEWDEHVVLAMSLSKMGLPGLRTGIVVADPGIIEIVARFNAAAVLATPNLGQAVFLRMLERGRLDTLVSEAIVPHYRERRDVALRCLDDYLHGLDVRVHEPEGAFFLWLWVPGMPISSTLLYQRLKARNVVVLPGRPFFAGLSGSWAHRDECIRISYAQPDAVLEHGFRIIGEEVRKALG